MSQAEAADVDANSAEELDRGLLNDFLGPRVRILWNLLSAGMAEALAPSACAAADFPRWR